MDAWSPVARYDRSVTSATSEGTTEGRRLRADAQRNRARILAAAEEVFADRGLAATLHDVAEHAGVGVGTVYRRFPDKDSLVLALFEDKINQLVSLAAEAAQNPDPWAALIGFMRSVGRAQSDHRGLHEVLQGSKYAQECVSKARDQFSPLLERLVSAAHQQGCLRSDVGAADIQAILVMLTSFALYTQEPHPGAWERYLDLMADSLRARPDQLPLLVPPLTDVQIFESASSWQIRRRR